jgi:Cupin domain
MARSESKSQRAIDASLLDRRTMLERSVGAALAGTIIGAVGALTAEVSVAAAQQPAAQGAKNQGIRRIVTGHNARGKSYVVSDVRIDGGRAPNVFQTTGDHPLGPGGAGDPEAFQPSTMTQLDLPPGACSSNYVHMPPAKPDAKPLWHRTMTIDYNFLISGELVCILEEGEVVLSGPGDVVVQRNTNHAWRNNSSVNPCIFVAVLVPLVGKA